MSDPHSYWQELAAAALVGTDRRPDLPPPPTPLAELLGSLDNESPAAALLSAAAATALYTRAGALPTTSEVAPISPCPEDDLPPCGPRAARHLATILDGHGWPLLREWLEVLATVRRRPPDAALPELLEQGRATPELRPALLAVLGKRGRWLAALNPEWSYVAEGAGPPQNEAELTELWQTGTRNGRMFLLKALRASDPARARALIQSTWATEKADDRAAFVEALEEGLSLEDEPFLEAALDDRGKEVRANAAALLARLPESALARRMAARAVELVSYHGGLFPKIELRLPEACDKALQRDGVEVKSRGGIGERAWWLSEIVRRTPPATWCAAWSLAPAAILSARMPREWRDTLIEAWTSAAVAYRDQAWAEALADLALKEPERVPLEELLPILPIERREALLIRMLDEGRQPLSGSHPALPALSAAREPWSVQLARSVIAALGRRFAGNAHDNSHREDWPLRAALENFAMAIPPELADEAIAALPANLAERPYWAGAGHAFIERLRLRREMRIALHE